MSSVSSESSSVLAPASATAWRGATGSRCSTPVVARIATRLPASALVGISAPFRHAATFPGAGRRNINRRRGGGARGGNPSFRANRPADDPGVLAHLPHAGEPVVLEQLDGRAEQEPALRDAAVGHLGDRLDEPAAGRGDLVERTAERGPGDAPTAMLAVDVEAGDPPVGRRRRVLLVDAAVLDVRQLGGAAVLAPALRDAVLVEDQRGVRPAGPHELLLDRAVAGLAGAALRVEADAPAAAEDPVVALDDLGEGVPGGRVERPDGERHQRPTVPASSRASSAGLLTIGQWPESRSANSTCLAAASSGTSPEPIHSQAWPGENSGHTTTTGTSKRRSSVSRTTPLATPSGTGIAAADIAFLAASSRSAESGPSNFAQPGNGMAPSASSKKSA